MTDQVSFKIIRHIAKLGEPNENNWQKELNIVSWNEGSGKYDIRDWSEDHEHMSRGITFDRAIAWDLGKALEKEFLGDDMSRERAIQLLMLYISQDAETNEYIEDTFRDLGFTYEEIEELGFADYIKGRAQICFMRENSSPIAGYIIDETEFDTEDIGELQPLWEEFSEEEQIPKESIISIHLIKMDFGVSRDARETYDEFWKNARKELCNE